MADNQTIEFLYRRPNWASVTHCHQQKKLIFQNN